MKCVVCGKRAYSEYCVQHKPRKKIAVRQKLEYKPLDPCEICGSTWHYTSLCPRKQKKIGVGKVWKRWDECKTEWKALYGIDHVCHYCGIWLDVLNFTLDHLIPRSRAPSKRYDFNNLVPACADCNFLKGSVTHDEYAHTCH